MHLYPTRENNAFHQVFPQKCSWMLMLMLMHSWVHSKLTIAHVQSKQNLLVIEIDRPSAHILRLPKSFYLQCSRCAGCTYMYYTFTLLYTANSFHAHLAFIFHDFSPFVNWCLNFVLSMYRNFACNALFPNASK